ncbi:MAG: acyl-protein synthetase [Myxococcota bacterium]
MTLLSESDALHARVRAFAESSRETGEHFEQLALDIARYQATYNSSFARLIERRCAKLESIDDIPAVPTDAFRLTRVATYPAELDVVRFVTSGTSGDEHGIHPLRTTATYEALSVAFGRRALVAGNARHTVVALAPLPEEPARSSLGFMMAAFMQAFDGRALTPAGEPLRIHTSERWLISDRGIDVAGLERAASLAARRCEPLLLLATSFALVGLLDTLSGASLPLPPHSVVMQTGGYKGRTREVPAAELREGLSRCFALPETSLVSEYGMTELCSQLYEGTLPGAELSGPRGVYLAPSWLRVTPVDPVSLTPVAAGEVGIARFVDLANIDSAVAIVTRDLVRQRESGIELLGRSPGAPPRGCSLSIEALLSAASS